MSPVETPFDRPFVIRISGSRGETGKVVIAGRSIESDGVVDARALGNAVTKAQEERAGVVSGFDFPGEIGRYRVEILAGRDRSYHAADVFAACDETAVLNAHLEYVAKTCPTVREYGDALRVSVESGDVVSVVPLALDADQATIETFDLVSMHAPKLPEELRRRIRDLRYSHAGLAIPGSKVVTGAGSIAIEWTSDDPTLVDAGVILRTVVSPDEAGFRRIMSGRPEAFKDEVMSRAKGVAAGAFDYEETCERIGESSYMDAVDRCAEAMRLASIGVVGAGFLYEYKALREDDLERGFVAVHLLAASPRDARIRGALLMAAADPEADPDESPVEFLERVGDSLELDRVLRVGPIARHVEAMEEVLRDVAALGEDAPEEVRALFRGHGDEPATTPRI